MPEEQHPTDVAGLTATIVSAFVENNSIGPHELPALIASVASALKGATGAAAAAPTEALKPAVPVRRSVRPDAIICLEDGQAMKSLKRHLAAHHQLTPEQYRQRWGLPSDYPMVAPDYAARRSELAKAAGLGAGGRKPPAKAAAKAPSKGKGPTRK